MTKNQSTNEGKRLSKIMISMSIKQDAQKDYAMINVPDQHLYYPDEIGIFFQELKQHCHMPSRCLNAMH